MQRHRTQRGFTLLELMLTTGIGIVLATSFFSIMAPQNENFVQTLDIVDAHQNARAALNVVRWYVRTARWGFAADASAAGTPLLGECYSTSAPTTASQRNCNNIDSVGGKAPDRLRVAYIVSDSETISDQNTASSANCTTGASATATTQVLVAKNPATAFVANGFMGIGGTCATPIVGGITVGNDLATYTSDSGAGSNCLHRYNVARWGSSATTFTCASGYAAGFTFGRAVIADFYISADAAGTPRLMMRLDPRQAIGNANNLVLAYGIEDLQISYGVDAGMPPDRYPDNSPFCDDPRSVADGGTCALTNPSTGTAYTTPEIYNRIVAVKIAITVRTDQRRRIARDGSTDGYDHYTYTTTVNLRNNYL